MGKLKNWQLVVFTALITMVCSIFGSMLFYGFTSDREIIKNSASETYVDMKVSVEQTQREIADNRLRKEIDKKAEKEDVEDIKKTLTEMRETDKETHGLILDIWKELKRNN
jgi:hypothetical protein